MVMMDEIDGCLVMVCTPFLLLEDLKTLGIREWKPRVGLCGVAENMEDGMESLGVECGVELC